MIAPSEERRYVDALMKKWFLSIIGFVCLLVLVIFLGKHPQIVGSIFTFVVNVIIGFVDFVQSHV